MKWMILLFLSFSLSTSLLSQSLAGKWKGYYTVLEDGANSVPKIQRVETRLEAHPVGRTPRVLSTGRPDNLASTSTRIREIKIGFEVHCVENADKSYEFSSLTQIGHSTSPLPMEYEIIGNDTLYLVEVGTKAELGSFLNQQMILKIAWQTTRKNKKGLVMKGPWYYENETIKQGEVFLTKEE